MSQGHVIKWAMECEHDPLAPPLSAEKWKCLVLLAWAGDKTHNRIEMTTAEIAAMANLDVDVAARFIRELRAEGPLCDTGERIGKNGRTAIYEFVPGWASDARAQALAREAAKKARRGRVKHGANTVIESGDHGANTVINGEVDHGAGSVANTVIKAPSIYGFNELPITPNKTKGDGARAVIENGSGDDALLPLAGEASPPAAPVATGVEVNLDHRSIGETTRSCSAQAERDACAASAYGGGDPMPSETSNPRTRAKRVQPATVDDLVEQFRKLCGEGVCSWPQGGVLERRMVREFERLVRERGATAAMMRAAVPLAQKRVGKVGRPSGAAIVRAMSSLETVEDATDFFDRPAAAGTHAVPGNETVH